MHALAILLAAGRGTRLGADRPKGLVLLGGQTLLERSARALGAAAGVVAIQPVLPANLLDGDSMPELEADWLWPVAGGDTRQASVAAGLAAGRAARADLEWVLVHDAARCLILPADVETVLAAAAQTGAAAPIVPVTDTVKRLDADGAIAETLDRSRLGLVQTPQAFRVGVLAEALEKAERDGFSGTDCASLVERLGVRVRACPGRPENLKITRPEDLVIAEAMLAARREPA